MKVELNSKTKHDLLSPIASLLAQLELLKRSSDYAHMSEDTKSSLDRMSEKLLQLSNRLKEVFQDTEEK